MELAYWEKFILVFPEQQIAIKKILNSHPNSLRNCRILQAGMKI
jgi:hypothetical protein